MRPNPGPSARQSARAAGTSASPGLETLGDDGSRAPRAWIKGRCRSDHCREARSLLSWRPRPRARELTGACSARRRSSRSHGAMAGSKVRPPGGIRAIRIPPPAPARRTDLGNPPAPRSSPRTWAYAAPDQPGRGRPAGSARGRRSANPGRAPGRRAERTARAGRRERTSGGDRRVRACRRGSPVARGPAAPLDPPPKRRRTTATRSAPNNARATPRQCATELKAESRSIDNRY